jgi:hypothetical protein
VIFDDGRESRILIPVKGDENQNYNLAGQKTAKLLAVITASRAQSQTCPPFMSIPNAFNQNPPVTLPLPPKYIQIGVTTSQ